MRLTEYVRPTASIPDMNAANCTPAIAPHKIAAAAPRRHH